MHERMNAWTYECMNVWMYERMHAWTYEYMARNSVRVVICDANGCIFNFILYSRHVERIVLRPVQPTWYNTARNSIQIVLRVQLTCVCTYCFVRLERACKSGKEIHASINSCHVKRTFLTPLKRPSWYVMVPCVSMSLKCIIRRSTSIYHFVLLFLWDHANAKLSSGSPWYFWHASII